MFFGGARGGGKTDGVLGKWAVKEEIYGQHFNARMFRKSTTTSEDAIERAKEIYLPLGARFNESKLTFRMPHGGRVSFGYLDSLADADTEQGKNRTDAWVEEAGQHASPAAIDRLFGALRSSHGVPAQLILTANPGGAGQHWLAERYGLIPFPSGPKIVTRQLPDGSTHRMAVIPSRITDNQLLIKSDPGYMSRLQLVGSRELVKAWLEGDWSAIEGAFFPEWSEARHVIEPFEVPRDWARFRSMDWGSASPFSVGWWAVVSEPFRLRSGRTLPRGALVRYREWYGAGAPNVGLKLTAEQIADGIADREKGERMAYGVLDPSTFKEDGGPSIPERMRRQQASVGFRPGDNTRVSRVGAMGGWDVLRQRLVGTARKDEVTGMVDWSTGSPMIFVFRTSPAFIRQVATAQHDQARPEDLDCLIAGTMVSTPAGPVPIEEIGLGALVDTPIGPRQVIRSVRSGSGATAWVRFSDGRTIEGTAHHAMYAVGKGLVALGDLQCQDILTPRIKWSKSLNIAVRCIGAMRGACTTIREVAASAFIVRFGWTLATIFRPAGMCITSTTTTITMNSPTLPACRPETTGGITSVSASLVTLDKGSRNGVALTKERSNSGPTLGRCRRPHQSENFRAGIVAMLSLRDTLVSFTARVSAWRRQIGPSSWFVRPVARRLRQSETPKSRYEPVRIVAVGRCAEPKPVYDLTVEGAHLFYANGFLSSNTDAEDHALDEARYGCMSRPWIAPSPKHALPAPRDYGGMDRRPKGIDVLTL